MTELEGYLFAFIFDIASVFSREHKYFHNL